MTKLNKIQSGLDRVRQLDSTPVTGALGLKQDLEWWRGAVIYQVYPRSFQDTNGDGIGDIRGVIQRLDYIADLGVDALWLSPFFKSPMKDFGYDISDFRAVDPIFGNLDDFDELVDQAKRRSLKIMIDQVLSHTSDQHQWFIESRGSQDNPKADWYVWADASEDGAEPNNWLSIFGGSAWAWDAHRGQYYLHNFLESQPDLNYHCDELRTQILDELEFWLKRGVDGFRLDAINFCYHDRKLRSNPIKPEHERTGRGFSPDNPYAAQYHYYDNTQPENLAFLESVRELLNRYPGAVTLGEINSENSLQTLAEYTSGENRLHMGYNFELLASEYSADYIKNTVEALEQVIDEGWPCWAISNHDVVRVVSRWGSGVNNAQFAKMSLSLAATLRGTLCVYQGEELGLTEADIPRDQLQDPYGIQFWPEFKGRDGCRTPMPWNDSELAGFTDGQPWLPVAPEHRAMNVRAQATDHESVLNYYRAFLKWRARQRCLLVGDIRFLDAPDNMLMIERAVDDQQGTETLIACFNLSDSPVNWTPEVEHGELQICGASSGIVQEADGSVSFGAYGFTFVNYK